MIRLVLILTFILGGQLAAQENPGRSKQRIDASSTLPKYRIEKKWSRYQELDASAELQARDFLIQTTGSTRFDEKQLNDAREFYKKQIRTNPDEIYFILRLEERIGDQELRTIAEDVAPDDRSSRDSVTVTFYLKRVPIGGAVFARVTIRSDEVNVSRTGLTQEEYDCFISSELPPKSRVLGTWLDQDSIVRIEGKKPDVTLVRYEPSGEVSGCKLLPVVGRATGFKSEVEDCELTIQNGSLVKSVRGIVVATYAKAPVKRHSSDELQEIQTALAREKQKLNELLDQLLIAKDDSEYESIPVQTNGKFHDLYEEIRSIANRRPLARITCPFRSG